MPLCTRSEVYIGLVCPGIGLSQGAADDARRQGAGQVSQLTAGSEFAFERPMGGSHAAREECGDPKKSGFSLGRHALLGTGPLAVVRLSLKQHLRENNNWSTTTRQ